MKKIVLIGIIILSLIVVAVSFGFYYINSSSILNDDDPNVIAKVNDVDITLSEIENLYDMYHVHVNISTPSVEKVQKEYAKILYTKIKQLLVAHELEKRGIKVTDEEVKELEIVILGDDLNKYEEKEFADEFVSKFGINFVEWKKQLRPQLENEKLKQLLLKEINISSEETMRYAELLEKEYKKNHEKFDFFKIIASPELLREIRQDKTFTSEELEQKDFSIENFVAKYEEKGATVFQSLFDNESLPDEYKTVLSQMKIHTFSEIISKGKENYILYLLKKENSQNSEGAVDLYLLAEERLLQEKLPEVYNKWLEQAMKNAKIYIVDSFSPKNVFKEKDSNKIQNLQDALQDLDADLKKLP